MLRYWLWLSTRKHIGNRKKLELLEHFGTPEAVYLADDAVYDELAVLTEQDKSILGDKSLKEADRILRDCDNKRISILTWDDPQYPSRLKAISDPPLILYYEGCIPDLNSTAVIGMVGTRTASLYGMKHAKELGYQLGRGGAIIVSGIAVGIDSMSLEGALVAGTTVVSVLGNGTDVIYPKRNKKLYDDVRARGCLISEFPPGTKPLGTNFPSRNRIISGLSLGVVVVEAPASSGALITARTALDQGRDVFTIPANLGVPSCAGNLKLLKDGAILIEDGTDVLREYSGRFDLNLDHFSMENVSTDSETTTLGTADVVSQQETPDKKSIDKENFDNYIDFEQALREVSEDCAIIMHLLAKGDLHLDAIIEKTAMGASKVSVSMTILQIKKFVKRLPGLRFALADNIKVR